MAAVIWRSPRLRARLLRLWLWLRRAARSAVVAGAAGVIFSLNNPALGAGSLPIRAATITVAAGEVAAADNGLCSLIEAIHNANDTASGAVHADCASGDPTAEAVDTIALPSGSVFTLAAADNQTYGASGLPVITGRTIISGSHGTTIRRDAAAGPFRVLAVGREGQLDLNGITVSGGQATSPASTIDVTYATSGGGILNMGELRLQDTTLSGNTAAMGGGVYNVGRLGGSGAHFIHNDAAYDAAALLSLGHVGLDDVDIRENGSRFSASAVANEGDMKLDGGYLIDNESPTGLSNRGELTIYSVVFENGGVGLDNTGQLTMEAVTLSGHEIALFNSATALVNRTAIIDNGRGIINGRGRLTLVNSTLSGNQTGGDGGGILVEGGEVDGSFDTISNNSAGRGGGLFVVGHYDDLGLYLCAQGAVDLSYSIISGNHAPAGREAYVERDVFRCAGSLSLNKSLLGHDGDAGVVNPYLSSSFVPDEPAAAILSHEWTQSAAATPHHPLSWGSPAVDALPNEACELPPPFYAFDQLLHDRNVDGDGRPSANECDIGAIEQQPLPYHVFAPFAGRGAAQR
ncbi:MAG: hypothetical protein KA170_01990 [Candidatus Promineofilum sp.]|nr:hypothetical protein [Promineifilum sp.]